MKTTPLEMKVHDFLAQKRIAVAGVSRDNREGIKRLAGGRRVLPSTRYQRDCWCLPDDVRRRRRLWSHVHAVDPQTQWRTPHVTGK
jgi:hypothetical protein